MSKPKTNVVTYDASGQRAELGAKANSALRNASSQAFTSMGTSNLVNQQALDKVREGTGLLGMYLQDRNASISNQVPIDQGFLSKTNDLTSKYAARSGSLFGGTP
jgi:hypothetical protein